jgi:chemotaxis protein histidine kinase CheA
MPADDHEIITPPNTLKNKVSFSPNGVDLEMLEKAEQIIASLQGNYLEWVQEDLNKLQAHYDRAMGAADADGRQQALADIFHVAHDVKGQGGSFGYHLMTAIGNQLCRFVEKLEGAGAPELEVVKLHIDAMRLVIAERMEGTGGTVGEKIVAGLQAVISKVAKG